MPSTKRFRRLQIQLMLRSTHGGPSTLSIEAEDIGTILDNIEER